MFDIGWSEFLVIGVVALIAIGPKELPGVLRAMGQWMAKIKRMAADFQGQFNEAMREADMADLKKQAEDLAESTKKFATLDDPLADVKPPVVPPIDVGAPPPSQAPQTPAVETPSLETTSTDANAAVTDPAAAPEQKSDA